MNPGTLSAPGAANAAITNPGVTLVLAKPERGVSTKEAYAAFDEARDITHVHLPTLLFDAARGSWDQVLRRTCNTFEQLIEVPERVPIKTVMRRNGSTFSMMSGSGPTVFGVFPAREQAEACAGELRAIVPDVFVCEPVPAGLTVYAES